MKCPKCGNEMKNLGNLSGSVFLSNPPQWDKTHVCDGCRVQKLNRVHGISHKPLDLSDYELI